MVQERNNMGTDLSIKPSDSSEKPMNPHKTYALVFGCCSLIVSAGCFVTIPMLLLFMMTLGADGGDRTHIETVAFGSTILLVISPIVAVVAGLVGIVLLILWGIEMLKTLSTNSR